MDGRAAGLLLHPTSLPGRFPVGDLGPELDRFLDWAGAAGQGVWQLLPLGPTEDAGAPYSCLSAFAGNPLLISPERLARDGLLDAGEISEVPAGQPGRVDYPTAIAFKEEVLRMAWRRFRERPDWRGELDAFAAAPEQQTWLADWTLFAALRRRFQNRGWWDWPAEIMRRDGDALAAARRELEEEIGYEGFLQLVFFRQWERVREEARRRGIRIFGDLPIYVAYMSAEVWARRDLFELDRNGHRLSMAGCPPDYFAPTGQLWGNPIFRWDRMAEDGYAWWADRLEANLRLYDLVRLDHFRGFAGYWRVPGGETTAENGTWVTGPGLALFEALRGRLGELPLVAEDLGEITPDVVELRRTLELPGMRVLHFGFDDPSSPHAPHHHESLSVVYTGTHDNDTTVGWYQSRDPETRRRIDDYLGLADPGEIHWSLVRAAYTSVAELAVVPVQDVLGLGSEARMNVPGEALGHWAWRLEDGQLHGDAAARLRRLAELTGRAGR